MVVVGIDRVAADRPYYSGKNRCHGMNIQVLAAPDGTIVWTSGSRPSSVHDLTAARIWGIIRRLLAADLVTLANKGSVGAVVSWSGCRTRGGGRRSGRRSPTPPMPSCAVPANGQMRS
ncbi:transposase family protein [Sphaerimonospora sp. CA-214678]|uniref:transposase family protein n=1 Tax=Sphaerimonospora sp. CA-214678 TaxID=3240029 RepID=UPI003D8CAADB